LSLSKNGLKGRTPQALTLYMGLGNFLDTTMKTGYFNKLCVKCLYRVIKQLGYNIIIFEGAFRITPINRK
jgi:hypothetical protein